MTNTRLHQCCQCSKLISKTTGRWKGALARVCNPCWQAAIRQQRIEEGRREFQAIING